MALSLKDRSDMNTILNLLGVIFSLVGLSLLAVGGYLLFDTRAFLSDAAATSGTVISLSLTSESGTTLYAPIVSFVTGDGESLVLRSNAYSEGWKDRQGDIVKVLYDPADPKKAKIDSLFQLWGATLIFSGVGVVFSGVGLGIFGYRVFARRGRQWLLSHGRLIITDFKGIELNERVSLRRGSNVQHPFRIISEWYDSSLGQLCRFESENLWFNPEDHISSDHIQVYIDPNNPRKYYMDVSFLPKK